MRVVDDHSGPVSTVLRHGGLSVAVMDSIAFATGEHAGQAIVTGSHGGASAGEYARRCGVAAVACNDAGIGKDKAGVAGLAALDGVVGVAVGHDTARIGDGHDTWANGIISYVNESAREAGIRVGEPLSAAFTRLAAGGVPC
ncbi:hypothetical protein ACFWQL_10410 [Amycolatopsis thermoflava]|uniref:hypothetical protein n=1 Tax=Amycolatopsis thermoflava TaxID=84480 RepID=UPI0036648213